MSKYKDILSYRLAVKVRSHKTIMVEGVSDKCVLNHFLLARNYHDHFDPQYFIDDVSIIKQDESLSGLGNKRKALIIVDRIRDPKFASMIDREWDNVDTEQLNESQFTQSHTSVYLTKGHSIENYWFDANAAIGFLIHCFPNAVDQNYLSIVNESFSKILRFAAAYSLAARNSELITRTSELIDRRDISWNQNDFELMVTFNQKLDERGSNYDFAAECNRLYTHLITPNQSLLRWICHGHLGEEAIRGCMATIGAFLGLEPNILTEIERGKKGEKLSHDSDFIARQELAALDPLDKILEWVREDTPV